MVQRATESKKTAKLRSALVARASEMDRMNGRQDTDGLEPNLAWKENGMSLGADARDLESDDGKFASLAADFVVRGQGVWHSNPPSSLTRPSNAQIGEQNFGRSTDGFLVTKGAAQPSTILLAPGESSPAFHGRDVRQVSQEEDDERSFIEQVHARWDAELEAALLKAEAFWKAEEAERLAAAQSQWQVEFGRALESAQAEATRNNGAALERDCLRGELATMQAALVEREAALARECVAAERTRGTWHQAIQDALSKAEMSWKAGEAARIAAAETQWRERSSKELSEARAQVEAAHDQINQLSHVREELATAQTVLADREAALARAEIAIAQTHDRWQQEAQEAVLRAEATWKAGEAVRFAAAETQWREKSEKALVKAKAEEARNDRLELELNHIREELATAQTVLADREAASARAEMAIAQTHDRWQQEAQEAVLRAEVSWKSGEGVRFAAAEALWREKAQNALAGMDAAEARNNGLELERNRLRDELATVQAALVDRETAAAREWVAIERTREGRQQEIQDALSQAKAAWKAEEAARFAVAEAQWREASAQAVVEARAQSQMSHDQSIEFELNCLREEAASMKAALADRETALARECVAIERTRESSQREIQEALSQAKAAWKAGEAARFAAAEEQWRTQSPDALSETLARGARRENSFGKENIGTSSHATNSRSRSAAVVLKPDRIGFIRAALKQRDDDQIKSHALRNIAVAILLAVAGIVFYPRIAPLFSENAASSGNMSKSAAVAAPVSQKAAGRTMVVIDAANARTEPSTMGTVVSTLPRGLKIATIEERRNWTLVRWESESGKTGRGQAWVYTSSLGEADGSDAKPAAATRKLR